MDEDHITVKIEKMDKKKIETLLFLGVVIAILILSIACVKVSNKYNSLVVDYNECKLDLAEYEQQGYVPATSRITIDPNIKTEVGIDGR